jgi:hypothetical protein
VFFVASSHPLDQGRQGCFWFAKGQISSESINEMRYHELMLKEVNGCMLLIKCEYGFAQSPRLALIPPTQQRQSPSSWGERENDGLRDDGADPGQDQPSSGSGNTY